MQIDAGHGRASHNHYLGEFATIGIPSALALFAFIMLQGRLLWRTSVRIRSKLLTASSHALSPQQSLYALRIDHKRASQQDDDAHNQERNLQRDQARDRALSQMYLIVLQGLMIFQSVALIFRGGRRMIEWSFLAVYTAAVLIYRHPSSTDEQ